MTPEQMDEQTVRAARDRYARAYFDLKFVVLIYAALCWISYSYHFEFNAGIYLFIIYGIFSAWTEYLPLNRLQEIKLRLRLLRPAIGFLIFVLICIAIPVMDLIYQKAKPLQLALWPIMIISGMIYATIGVAFVIRLLQAGAVLRREELKEEQVEAELYSDEPTN